MCKGSSRQIDLYSSFLLSSVTIIEVMDERNERNERKLEINLHLVFHRVFIKIYATMPDIRSKLKIQVSL